MCMWYPCTYMHVCAHVCLNTYAQVLGPWMYPPAGDRHGAPVGSSRSGRRRETAGHWCWRFGSECGVCYGRTTLLPWAVQSHRHRRKLEKEREIFQKRKTDNKIESIYVFKCSVSVFFRLLNQCLMLTHQNTHSELSMKENWNRKYSSSEYSKASQVKHCGLNIANMWHLDIKARLIIILVVL